MRKLRYAVLLGALGAAGVYLFVYLVRWEWHRAVVAGVLFVAAEVALASAAILDRLRSIQHALEAGPGPAGRPAVPHPDPSTLARVRQSAPEPRTSFEWLSRPGSEMSVFVPLLLGAGVVLSGVAWLVERVARATATPGLERGLAVRLAPLGLPVGTLVGTPAPALAARRPPVVHLAAALAAVGAATVGLDALADATQSRPDPRVAGTTSVVVGVDPGSARSPAAAAAALWGACSTQLGSGFELVGTAALGGGEVRFVVRPGIGMYAERRLRGCINDATTDRIRATVRSVAPGGAAAVTATP